MRRWSQFLLALTVASCSALALALRYHLRDTWNSDLDLYLVPWYQYIRSHGGLWALGNPFSNYTPAYLYLLALATYLPLAPVAAIKSVSTVLDFVAAVLMARLVRLCYPTGALPWQAYLAVLFAPTIVLNSAHWAQCDVIYSSALLACVYFIAAGRPLPSMLAFSTAFALKAQAAFLAPFVLVLLLRRMMPWRYAALPPLVYCLFALPAALLGRSWWELLTLYVAQSGKYRELAMNAPNLYVFIPNTYYTSGVRAGLAVATVAALAFVVAAWRSPARFDTRLLVRLATLSVALLPFALPKMHDRYFYPADLLSIALGFCVPRLCFMPLLFQLGSTLAYVFFLGLPLGDPARAVRLGALVNAAAVAVLVVTSLQALYPRRERQSPAR